MLFNNNSDNLNVDIGSEPARRPVDIHVGARLSKRRKELGFCQESLGQKLELNKATIKLFESGETRIGSSNLFKLSQILNTSMSFFYSD